MGLRWGFKTEAADLARETRTELGLSPFDQLDPHELARHLEIPILTLSELAAASGAGVYFLVAEPEAFSAVTVFEGLRRIIVHNDSHSQPRQNSNIAHELAHGLLLHTPSPALDGATGCRRVNSTYEDEANWLAGELLVTREMALAVARGQFTQQEAIYGLGVSNSMLRWRLNMTGAHKRAARERAARGPSKRGRKPVRALTRSLR